jgi:hypothetical protein
VRRAPDLALAAALAALCAVLCIVLPDDPVALRIVPAVLLVLVLPGYALCAAVLHPELIGRWERAVLTLALSTVAAVITALVLNAAWTLDRGPWAAGLATATVVAALAGAARGHGRAIPRPRFPAVGIWGAAALLTGAGLAASALVLGRTVLEPPADARGASALWISPAREGATVGVRNDDLGERRYELVVRVAGRTPQRIAPFVLEPGQERRVIVAAPAGPTGRPPVVTASLTQLGTAPVVVRRVALRAGREPAVTSPLPRCAPPHPLRSATGCYRIVKRDGRRLRYYRDGRRVAAP